MPQKLSQNVKIEIKNVPQGKYELQISKIGYKNNDPYTTYLSLGSPNQLTKQQVDTIKNQNAGTPVSTQTIKIEKNKPFIHQTQLLENEVILLNLTKL